jgi:predicted ribosomally synthesized peptide with SipW-like signal peptide
MNIRKLTTTALVAGAIAAAAGAGTFASFSASTTNAANVFETGKIALSNTKQSGTACVSGYTGTGSGSAQSDLDDNDNGTCDALVNLSLRSPGDVAEAHLALANTGDYDGALQLFLDGCTNATVATPAGSGNLCDKLEVYVQQTQSDYSTAVSSCVFPYSASAACSTSFGATGDSLTDLATSASPTAPKPATPISLAKAATKHFVIKVSFPDGGFDDDGNGADNAFQNRRASFDVTWRLQEA